MEIIGFWQEDLDCDQFTVAVTKLKGNCFAFFYFFIYESLENQSDVLLYQQRIFKLKESILTPKYSNQDHLNYVIGKFNFVRPSCFLCPQCTSNLLPHTTNTIDVSFPQYIDTIIIRLDFVYSVDSHWSGRCLCLYLSVIYLNHIVIVWAKLHFSQSYKVSSQFFAIHLNVQVYVLYIANFLYTALWLEFDCQKGTSYTLHRHISVVFGMHPNK